MKRAPDQIGLRGSAVCGECKAERNRARARYRRYERAGIPEGTRLCRWCGRPWPVGKHMTPQGRTCLGCRQERARARARVTRRERRERMTPAELEAERAKQAAKARRQRSTPEGRARHNAQQKAYRLAHPETTAAAQRRYREKVMADPERAAEWRDYQRIYHRIWRERKGMVAHVLSAEEYANGNGKAPVAIRFLPAEPLVKVISEWLALEDKHNIVRLSSLSGVAERTLSRVMNGDHGQVWYETADAVCAVVDFPLAALYPEVR